MKTCLKSLIKNAFVIIYKVPPLRVVVKWVVAFLPASLHQRLLLAAINLPMQHAQNPEKRQIPENAEWIFRALERHRVNTARPL
jgi:hypothetical protein